MITEHSEEFKQIVTDVLQLAKKSGATSSEVGISIDKGLSATVRLSNVDTIEFHRDKVVGITVYKGTCKGSVSTTDISKKAIEEAVVAACQIAEHTEEDDCSGLADKELMADKLQDLDLYHPCEVTAEQAIEWAKNCEKSALDYDKKINNSEGATYSTTNRFRIYANSHGFMGAYPSSRYSLSCSVIGQLNDSMQRNYDYTIARDIKDLASQEFVGKRAAQRTVYRLGSRKIKTCKAKILFVPEMAASLLGSFVAAISGGSLYRKASFLLDYLDRQVFPKFVTITEYPHLPKGLGSCMFDSEGVKTQERVFVESGNLRSYVLGSYSARKLKMQSTGNAGGVHNLTINPGKYNFKELIKNMHQGLIVTELLGHGTNIVTGDYSRGAAGFWVENGEIQHPVEEVTIAGNLKDIFMDIQAVGNDVDRRSNIVTGSLLTGPMMVAGA